MLIMEMCLLIIQIKREYQKLYKHQLKLVKLIYMCNIGSNFEIREIQ